MVTDIRGDLRADGSGMEVVPAHEQEIFRDATERFLGSESSVAAVRALAHSDDGFERGYWRQGATLGWTSLLVPEHQGGGSVSSDGVVDLALVADAFGRHAAPGPLVPANVVAWAVAHAGSEEQRDAVLPGILAGDVVPSWCVGPPAAHGGVKSGVRARRDGDDLILEGSQAPVEAANQADVLLVTADGETGLQQVLVRPDARGVSIAPLQSLDLTRRFGRVEFADVRVPASSEIGAGSSADQDVERQLQYALVTQAAETVGAARAVFEMTLQWTFDRYSFGRPLASYQAIKHRVADMKMWLDASSAVAAAAALSVQHEAADASATVSIAAAYIGEFLPELVQDCVQLHGGIGLTSDHDLHLFLRRVTVNRALHGTPADHRQRVASFDERMA